jgi:hypothetical protein
LPFFRCTALRCAALPRLALLYLHALPCPAFLSAVTATPRSCVGGCAIASEDPLPLGVPGLSTLNPWTRHVLRARTHRRGRTARLGCLPVRPRFATTACIGMRPLGTQSLASRAVAQCLAGDRTAMCCSPPPGISAQQPERCLCVAPVGTCNWVCPEGPGVPRPVPVVGVRIACCRVDRPRRPPAHVPHLTSCVACTRSSYRFWCFEGVKYVVERNHGEGSDLCSGDCRADSVREHAASRIHFR